MWEIYSDKHWYPLNLTKQQNHLTLLKICVRLIVLESVEIIPTGIRQNTAVNGHLNGLSCVKDNREFLLS